MVFPGNNQISDKELLCQFVVPFVNSESPDEAVKFYKGYYAEKESQKVFAEEVVKNFYILLRDMLQIAIMSHQGRKVPDEIEARADSIQRQIERAFQETDYYAVWNSKAGTFAFPKLLLSSDEFGPANNETIKTIVWNFTRIPNSPCPDGDGFRWIGLCPNCGIFFEKRRRDQEFCSRNCQVVASNRQRRDLRKI
ncbi:MAG: hypothetical protein AB1403_16650 [Candidatus Riflebacteria bacterium]